MVNHPPTSRITPTIIRCIACGYDLTGTPIGGVCPECGAPVEKSVVMQSRGLSSGKGTACMVLGILSLAACPGFGPIAIIMYFAAKSQMAIGGYEQSSHTMAKAGFIMGIISTVLLGLWMLFFGFAVML
jgi:hypothetical protein